MFKKKKNTKIEYSCFLKDITRNIEEAHGCATLLNEKHNVLNFELQY